MLCGRVVLTVSHPLSKENEMLYILTFTRMASDYSTFTVSVSNVNDLTMVINMNLDNGHKLTSITQEG